jgi:CrcB protein
MKEALILFPYVFIGGGIGASLRWGMNLACVSLGFKLWPGTLVVNLAGVILYGLSYKYMEASSAWSQQFIRVGLLGSLTTFSTFSYEVAMSIKQEQYLVALGILLLNIVFGILIAIGLLR